MDVTKVTVLKKWFTTPFNPCYLFDNTSWPVSLCPVFVSSVDGVSEKITRPFLNMNASNVILSSNYTYATTFPSALKWKEKAKVSMPLAILSSDLAS